MLPAPDAARFILRFGVFEANLATGELSKDGLPLKLQDQPFRILAMLLSRPGELVTREELQADLWPDAEYGEFEQGLNTAIKKVRQALGDTADNPRFIQTLPRKGYRFIAPVHAPDEPAAEVPEAESPVPAEAVPSIPRSRTRLYLAAGGGGLVLVAATVAAVMSHSRPPAVVPAEQFANPVPITTVRGLERSPSFSPDGRSLAFSWNGEKQDNFDIYIKSLDSEKLTRLTTDPALDTGAAWSPDGKQIAFVRKRQILLLPAAGGGAHEVKLAEMETWPPVTYHPALSWSPDGKWLAFSDLEKGTRDNRRPAIHLLSLETGQTRQVTTPLPDGRGDVGPAFSPDGRSLAFRRGVEVAHDDVFILQLRPDYTPTADPVRISNFGVERVVSSVAWMPDGRHLLLAKPWLFGRSEGAGLWLVDPTPGGTAPTLLQTAHNTGVSVDIAKATGDLAYSWNQSDRNIWRVSMREGARTPSGEPKPLIESTMDEFVPKFSPDGRQIVFVSKRSGAEEVWVSAADGSNPLQLTNMGYTGSPSWSPDGSHIVFDSMLEGQYEVYTMLATGGAVRRLTNHQSADGVAAYSADGNFIYFMSGRAGKPQVWRMRTDGSELTQITKGNGYLPRPSSDGRFLYYFKDREIWKVPAEGGEEVRLPLSPISSFLAFAVTRDAIYFIPDPPAFGDTWIERFDLASGKIEHVINIDRPPRSRFLFSPDSFMHFAHAGLSVSPDGRTLVWAQSDQSGSDLMLMRKLPAKP
jgi:Tol biopolymer transport system component/DNA-binding winged helix-turn-helix (wHTH) protein